MIDHKSYSKIKEPNERHFGYLLGFIFLIIFIYILFYYENLNFILLSLSIIFFLLSLIYPKIYKIPNKLWFYIGIFFGIVFTPIIMFLIFLLVVIPTGLIIMIFNRDILNQKILKKNKSYWTKRNDNFSIKNQF